MEVREHRWQDRDIMVVAVLGRVPYNHSRRIARATSRSVSEKERKAKARHDGGDIWNYEGTRGDRYSSY